MRIGFALSSIGDEGEKYFIDMSLKNPNYKDTEFELKKKYQALLKDSNGTVTLGTIYHIAEIYGWKKNIKFWAVDDKDKLRIPIASYKKFLEASGYCKYMFKSNLGSAASYLTVRVKDNIVEEVTAIDIKDFVMEYLSSLPIDEFKNTSRPDVIGLLD